MSLRSRWVLKTRQRDTETRLCQDLKITTLLAAALVDRGITTSAGAERFLDPRLEDLHSPNLLPDFDAAVSAILAAKERGEKIFVHGDYDVDGVTSAALFTRFLRKIGCEVIPHVPHRMREGYGIHIDVVQVAKDLGAKLFLTCDCGTGAIAQVEAAREAGMTVVVTDHHLAHETLPNAAAVVNPHRLDSKYPYPELSGVGVVFKVCEGVNAALGHRADQYRRAYLDLVTLGTVADVMPLTGENRIIVKHGLEQLQASRKPGLQALMDVTKFNRHEPGATLLASHIGFQLGPRLNAAGRIDDASLSLDLLLETDIERARETAAKLDELNKQRREEQEAIFSQAIDEVEANDLTRNLVLMVAGDEWHTGIVGIVAGKLVERYCRPAFVLKREPETGLIRGSARSVEGFHLGLAIDRVRPRLVSGGGHAMAAGIALHEDEWQEVYEIFNAYAAEFLTHEDLVPSFAAIGPVAMEEVNDRSVNQLQRLQPFGCANPTPHFLAEGLSLLSVTPTKNPEHVKLELGSDSGQRRKAMAFSMGEAFADIRTGSKLDVLFQASAEEFEGRKFAKWYVRDYRVRDA